MADERYDIPEVYGRYSQGLPLTGELAAMRDGTQKPVEEAPRRMTMLEPVEDVERDLERGERIALKEMVLHPGWPVFRRLLEKSFHVQKKGVISISQQDPLGNAQKIAEQWAYLNAAGAVRQQIPLLVQVEINALDGER
jgi:hypothetical protein